MAWSGVPLSPSPRRADDHLGHANDADAALFSLRLRHASLSSADSLHPPLSCGLGSPGRSPRVVHAARRSNLPQPREAPNGAWGAGALFRDAAEGMRLGYQAELLVEMIEARPVLATQQDASGATLLHWACFYGCPEAVIEALLLANPVAARVPNSSDGSLPMHVAASWGRSATVGPLPARHAVPHRRY